MKYLFTIERFVIIGLVGIAASASTGCSPKDFERRQNSVQNLVIGDCFSDNVGVLKIVDKGQFAFKTVDIKNHYYQLTFDDARYVKRTDCFDYFKGVKND